MPHCARCGAATFLCSCSGVPTGQDIVFPFPKLPEDATPQQRLERWQLHVTMNPSARQFDAARFVADMQAQGLVQCLERWVQPQGSVVTSRPAVCSVTVGCCRCYGCCCRHSASAPTSRPAKLPS